MSVIPKTTGEIQKMRQAGRLVALTFEALEKYIRPGTKLSELDQIAEDFILSKGAQTLYKGYNGGDPHLPPFPGVICASVNEMICHGIPSNRELKEGDIIGVDIGLRYQGYCGDACVTYPVGTISLEAQKLLNITRKCLDLGIAAAGPNRNLGEIGKAIEDYADSQNVRVVREYGGHGIGRYLHEAPSVSHIRMPGKGMKLQPGLVFTIEPMINLGAAQTKVLADRWTVVTADGSLSAQYEHTIAILPNGVEILSVP